MCPLTPQSLHSGKPDASCSRGSSPSLLVSADLVYAQLECLSVEMGGGGLQAT